MIPVSLKLSNFTSYGENVPELDFTKFHLSVICGQNGAGKSSILDSITWCIWGWSRVGDSADQLVRLGAQEMFVEFSFELDGHIFTIKRRRSLKSGGSSALELWSSTHNLTEGTIKATQQKIINTLHLSFETFTNSAFLRQGHADEFTTKGPSDRKRILADILGLSHYDLLEEKAKEKVKELQTKLTLLEYQLLEIEAELISREDQQTKKRKAEEDVEKIEIEIKNLEEKTKILRQEREALNLANEQRSKLIQNLNDNKSELEEVKQQGLNRKQKIDDLKKQLLELNIDEKNMVNFSDLQNQKDNFEKIKQQRLEVENKITQVKSEINLKNQQKENLQLQIKDISTKILDLKKRGSKCPTCGQEVNIDHKKQVEKNLNLEKKTLEEKIKDIDSTEEERRLKDFEEIIKTLVFDDQKYQDLKTALLDLENLQKQKERLIQIKASLESEEKVVLEMRTLFTNKKTQVDKLELEVSQLPDVTAKLSPLNQQLQEAENSLTTLRDSEKEARNLLGQMTELISRGEQTEKLQTEKLKQRSDNLKEKEAFESLAEAFGKKGIQAMIIETAIPEIEDEANGLLERLTEGRMKIALVTQKETKTKVANGERGIVETLDIIISDEMGDRPYENYSGGEQFRVNLAIRLALSKLLTRRAGAKLQFLVVDEGFGTQDAAGRARIVEVLDTIKHDFEKIVVITHLDELKEEFPTRIEVSKNSTGSTFEVVGV